MPRSRIDLLIHLLLAGSGAGTPSEHSTLLNELDEANEAQFEDEYETTSVKANS